MAHTISLPLSDGWHIEQEVVEEQGEEVLSYYAVKDDSSIELYVGNTPEDSDAKIECINSYMEAIGVDDDDDEVPVQEIEFLGKTGWYYEAEDDAGHPVILICVEPSQGVLVMSILSDKDPEGLDDLMTLVDENLTID